MTLYMIGGLPGSGKSTLARVLAGERHDGEWYEADDYHIGDDGVYRWKPENVKQAHQQCQASVEGDMRTHEPVILVANTFTRRWEREPYRELARKYGYRVVWLPVMTDLTDAELAERNIHAVPEETIRTMRARWEHEI